MLKLAGADFLQVPLQIEAQLVSTREGILHGDSAALELTPQGGPPVSILV